MASVSDRLAEGNVRQLVALSKQSEQLKNVQESTLRNAAHINDLREELLRLTKRKTELKSELLSLHPAETSIREVLLSDIQKTEFKPMLEETKKAVDIVRNGTEKEAEKIKFVDVSSAYRLAGQTVFLVNGGELLGIRLETFFAGQYFERFYLFLDFEEETLVLKKHTIPSFIPYSSLCRQYLNKDLKLLLEKLSDYLNFYVARKQQVQMLLNRQKRVTANGSSGFGHIVVEARVAERLIRIALVYDHLSYLPKTASVTEEDLTYDRGIETPISSRQSSANTTPERNVPQQKGQLLSQAFIDGDGRRGSRQRSSASSHRSNVYFQAPMRRKLRWAEGEFLSLLLHEAFEKCFVQE